MAGDLKAQFRISNKHLLTLAYQFMGQEEVSQYNDFSLQNYDRHLIDPRERQLGYARMLSFFDNKWFKEVKITGSYNTFRESRITQYQDEPEYNRENEINSWGAMFEVRSQPNYYWNIVSGVEFYQDQVHSRQFGRDLFTQAIYPMRAPLLDQAKAGNMGLYSLHTLDIGKLRLVV